MPFDRTWLPYLYLYGVGGLFFLAGLIVVLKCGALNLQRPRHRRWAKVLILGFCWYASIHAVGILAATYL